MLVEQQEQKKPSVEIQYTRAVSYEGNLIAQKLVESCFEYCDDYWRGLGMIPNSGLKLRKKYEAFDAEVAIPVNVKSKPDPKGCLCGNILKGMNKPTDCTLFGKACTPESPIGACMVSSEGTCAAYAKYTE